LASGQNVRTLTGHTYIHSVAFIPDGQTLTSSGDDWTIKLWNVTRGQEIRTFKGHIGAVCSVAFIPDGQNLASGSVDMTIKLWNPSIGQEVLTLTKHTGYVLSVAFSPDGKTLVSASQDQTIKIWGMKYISRYYWPLFTNTPCLLLRSRGLISSDSLIPNCLMLCSFKNGFQRVDHLWD
jgi:WD40 repeat protein